MESYRATALVSITEGPMYGPGDEITGPFDPDDEHNARLIEAGQITRLGAVREPSSPSGDAAGAEAPAEQQEPAADAGVAEGGGEPSSPTIERMSEKPTRGRRRG